MAHDMDPTKTEKHSSPCFLIVVQVFPRPLDLDGEVPPAFHDAVNIRGARRPVFGEGHPFEEVGHAGTRQSIGHDAIAVGLAGVNPPDTHIWPRAELEKNVGLNLFFAHDGLRAIRGLAFGIGVSFEFPLEVSALDGNPLEILPDESSRHGRGWIAAVDLLELEVGPFDFVVVAFGLV